MGAYSIAQAKAQFSGLLLAAQAGEDVVITRRGVAVATITPIAKPKQKVDWRRVKNLQAASAKALGVTQLNLAAVVRGMRDN